MLGSSGRLSIEGLAVVHMWVVAREGCRVVDTCHTRLAAWVELVVLDIPLHHIDCKGLVLPAADRHWDRWKDTRRNWDGSDSLPDFVGHMVGLEDSPGWDCRDRWRLDLAGRH